MKSLKELAQSLKNRYPKKQMAFIVSAFVLFLLLSWFIISNFIFIVDQLNTAFGTEVTATQTATQFDIEAFEELNLIE